MPTKIELQEAREAKKKELDKIDFTSGDEARSRFDALHREIRTLDGDIVRAAQIEDAERRVAATTVKPGQDSAEGRSHDVKIADYIKGGIAGRLDGLAGEWSQDYARRSGKAPRGIGWYPVANLIAIEARTQTTDVGPGGGYLVGKTLRPDLMGGLLKPTPVVSAMGASTISGLIGDVEIPVVTGEPTAQWVGENDAPTASDAAFGKRTSTPRTVAGLTQVSRRLTLQNSTSIEALLRKMHGDQLALAMDSAAINGPGASNQPQGILQNSGVNVLALGTNGLAPTSDHMADLIGLADIANVTAPRQFLTTAKVRKVAMKNKDSQNRPLGVPAFFQNEAATFSNQVPSNLTKGSGTDLSAVIYGDFSECYLLFWSAVDILVNPYADSVASSGGVLVHSFLDMDVVIRRPAAFSVIKDAIAA